MKKILYIHHSANLGGAPRSLRLILDEVATHKNCNVEVLLLKVGPSKKIIDNGFVSFIISKGLYPFHGSYVSNTGFKQAMFNIFGLVSTIFNLNRYVKTDYDIIHLNSTCLCFYAWLIKLKRPNTKIYCHIREPLRNDFWGQAIARVAKKYVDHFFAISKYDLQSIGHTDSEKCTVVHNYVNTDEYRKKSSAGFLKKEFPDKKIIGFFARLDIKNGIVDFIEIAKKLIHRKDIQFVAFGRSGLESAEVVDALSHITSNLKVYPMNTNVIEVMNDIDILACPFITPHFSRSVIEAAALSIPAIIYDVGSLNELVINGKTGLIINPNDKDSFVEGICRILDEGNISEMGSEARALSLKLFSHKNVKLIVDSYEFS